MNETQYIERLIERFLEGDTTLQEERQLDEFLAEHRHEIGSMPEAFQIVAQMFDEFKAMDAQTAPPVKLRHYGWLRWLGGIAVAAAAIIGIVTFKPTDNNLQEQTNNILVVELTPSGINVDTIRRGAESVKLQKTNKLAHQPVEKEAITAEKIEPAAVAQQVVYANGQLPCEPPIGFDVIPMVTGTSVDALMIECEMKILEDEFQRSNYSSTPFIEI